jgi:hypothetical protein
MTTLQNKTVRPDPIRVRQATLAAVYEFRTANRRVTP